MGFLSPQEWLWPWHTIGAGAVGGDDYCPSHQRPRGQSGQPAVWHCAEHFLKGCHSKTSWQPVACTPGPVWGWIPWGRWPGGWDILLHGRDSPHPPCLPGCRTQGLSRKGGPGPEVPPTPTQEAHLPRSRAGGGGHGVSSGYQRPRHAWGILG